MLCEDEMTRAIFALMSIVLKQWTLSMVSLHAFCVSKFLALIPISANSNNPQTKENLKEVTRQSMRARAALLNS